MYVSCFIFLCPLPHCPSPPARFQVVPFLPAVSPSVFFSCKFSCSLFISSHKILAIAFHGLLSSFNTSVLKQKKHPQLQDSKGPFRYGEDIWERESGLHQAWCLSVPGIYLDSAVPEWRELFAVHKPDTLGYLNILSQKPKWSKIIKYPLLKI